MRQVELACGREGRQVRTKALKGLRSWLDSSEARLAILHVIEIYNVICHAPLGDCEGLPPQYVALILR